MSATRKLQRQLSKTARTIPSAVQTKKSLRESLEGVSQAAGLLENLRLELLEKVQANQDLSEQVDALRDAILLMLPHLDAPEELKGRVCDLLKIS